MSVCHHRPVDYPYDQAPGAPIRSGIPEHGRIPKYYAVKARVSTLIDELGEGDALPPERDLAQRYEVSRETVRQALRELILEGRLARQGRGTVVAGPKMEQPLALASYTEGVRRQGRTPGRRLIGLERFPCPEALAAETGTEPGEPVWHLERVLLADDDRVGLESTYVSAARVPDLKEEFDSRHLVLRLSARPARDLLRRRGRAHRDRARHTPRGAARRHAARPAHAAHPPALAGRRR